MIIITNFIQLNCIQINQKYEHKTQVTSWVTKPNSGKVQQCITMDKHTLKYSRVYIKIQYNIKMAKWIYNNML